MFKLVTTILLFTALTFAVGAQTPAPSPTTSTETSVDPTVYLGLTPEGAYRLMGPPAEIYPVKATDDLWQVVHYFPSHQYLFWYNNRVWQVRLDKRYTGSFLGIKMGESAESIGQKLGKPLAAEDTWSVWQLPYKSFPRRVRLVFENKTLVDAYLFRSDF